MLKFQGCRTGLLLAVLLSIGLLLFGCTAKKPLQKPQSATKDAPYQFEDEGKIPAVKASDAREETDFEEVPLAEEEVFEEEMDIPPAEELVVGRPVGQIDDLRARRQMVDRAGILVKGMALAARHKHAFRDEADRLVGEKEAELMEI